MQMKPTQQEEEYFARLEFERRRKVLEERETQAAEEERRRILAVARGRCPKCAGELVPVPYRGVELDKCSRCQGVWLDVGELEEVGGDDVAHRVLQRATRALGALRRDMGASTCSLFADALERSTTWPCSPEWW